ncbi:MAG: 4'-phosphopantetheinyl transferase family protein [Draconibacterium sp.]
MPFVRKIENADGRIGIWKLTETPEQLLRLRSLSENEETQYQCIKAESRKKEFLATRILLSVLEKETTEIHYTPSGKPFLPGEEHKISISHSADYAVVFLSPKKIGVDIENCDRKIDRVAHRFLSEKEKALIGKLDNQQCAKVFLWAAKEAIFKCSLAEGIQFNEQILIDTFIPGREGGFTAQLLLPDQTIRYRSQYFIIENNVLVYCVEQGNQML